MQGKSFAPRSIVGEELVKRIPTPQAAAEGWDMRAPAARPFAIVSNYIPPVQFRPLLGLHVLQSTLTHQALF